MILLLLLLQNGDSSAGYTYPPQHFDNATATLTVTVCEGDALPHVLYSIAIASNDSLEVEPPVLDDATGAWKTLRSSAWAADGNRLTWTKLLDLEQTRPGVIDLPDVKVRFRTAPEAAWQQAEWTGILRDLRELPLPSPPTSSTSYKAVLGPIAVLLAFAAAVAIYWRWPRTPLTPRARALLQLTQLEISRNSGTNYFTQLVDVIRRYLTDRYQLPAFQQTTADLLRQTADLPGVEHLQTLLEVCDIAKFASSGTDAAAHQIAFRAARALLDAQPDKPRKHAFKDG
jgi:hypothetical protein